MATVVNNKWEHGDTVYLVTDPEQMPRIIVAYKVYKQGEIMYELNQGINSSMHYEFEITTERNILVDK